MEQPVGPQEELMAPVAFGSTVTILFSDIRGFTEYTDAHGDEVAYRMLQHHNSLVQEQIALYGGHVVKTLGDSYMVSFESARTAVTCAIAMQRALEQYNRAQQGPKIETGVGIDTGEPVREAGDFFGGTVNRASRICGAAGSGRVLVSEVVRHVVGRMEGAEWIDRGFFEVKGFQEPQHLFEVDWSGAAAVRAAPVASPHGAVRPATVASLPSESLLGSPRLRRRTWLLGAGAAAAVLLVAGVLLANGRNFTLSRPGQDVAGVTGKSVTLPGGLAARVLFHDNFADPGAGLFEKSERGDDFEYRYVDGQLAVRHFPAKSFQDVIISALRGQPFSDFAVELQVRATSIPEAVEYGIGFRGTIGKGQYLLAVRPDSQSWRLALRRGRTEEVTRLLNAGQSPAISKGLEPNQLLVVARGASISAYANGQLLTSFADDTLTEGSIRLMVINLLATDKEGLGVSFMDFKIYALEP